MKSHLRGSKRQSPQNLFWAKGCLQLLVCFGGVGLRPVFVQGGHLTHFRKNHLQASQPRALLLAPFCPGSETMLGWPCEGTEPAGCPPCSDLGPTPCQKQTCVRARSSSELLSGDLSSKQARSNKARGTEAFLTLSVQALWEQNKRGFGNKQHKYVFTHAHNRLCAHSMGCEHTVAVLPLGPASKGKMETVTHSATKKLPVLALLSPCSPPCSLIGWGLGI